MAYLLYNNLPTIELYRWCPNANQDAKQPNSDYHLLLYALVEALHVKYSTNWDYSIGLLVAEQLLDFFSIEFIRFR